MFLNTSLAIYGLLKYRFAMKKSVHLSPSHLVSINVKHMIVQSKFTNGITLYMDPLNHAHAQYIGKISFKPHASFRPKSRIISGVFLVFVLIYKPFHIPCNASV